MAEHCFRTSLLLVLLLAASHLSGAHAESGRKQKITSKKEVVHSEPCPKPASARRGDRLTIQLYTMAEGGSDDPVRSAEPAEQDFVLGKHNVPHVNKHVKGMCVGDVRRLRVAWDGDYKMQYIVKLLKNPHGDARRVKISSMHDGSEGTEKSEF
eukprot:TRINITY_DN2798_c0_g1_i2.p1 TRINITY_DN2798_c0_g1~~TRINITY_DN2798_c0_g1_i2.p1  ORF type:complete len:177 (-),score=29.59 TRINITY_DN2798_c0_g1_i2:143-604(-)